jgi:hypothetical protein
MKLAWIENNIIRDISPGNPVELYHQEIAGNYSVQVPDNAENGDSFVNGQLTKRSISAPIISLRLITADDFRNSMTLSEKLKWDSNNIQEIITAKIELGNGMVPALAKDLAEFLLSSNIISETTKNNIVQLCNSYITQ